VEQGIAARASRAWGVVTRRELLRAGVSEAGIKRRVGKGLLIPQYPGVYRVGHTAQSAEATYMAAVKACGAGAVLRGRAAAYHLGILKCRRPPPPEVMCRTERRIEGIETKRSRGIDARDVTTHRGIRVTTVPRTLVDLAPVLAEDELARVCHEAGVRYRTTPRHVKAVLARRPNAPGARGLWRVLTGETKVSLSRLEEGFLDLIQRAGLPPPETNRVAGTQRVDCRWPKHRVTVELDGYAFHNSRHSWEQGHRRARAARKRGDEFRRYTWHDVFEDPRDMLRELRELLA
jgi:hypothetical protein